MLLKDELYSANPSMIIDDVWGMVLAGMKTIQVSSSNLVMYYTSLPEVKLQLKAEIDSKLGPISDNLDEKFTMELADEFTYLLRCYWESLRNEPPAPLTTSTTFSQDVQLGGKTVREGDAILLNIEQIHKDPTIWHSPDMFMPERWD